MAVENFVTVPLLEKEEMTATLPLQVFLSSEGLAKKLGVEKFQFLTSHKTSEKEHYETHRKCKYPDVPCQQFTLGSGSCPQGAGCWYSHVVDRKKDPKKKLFVWETKSPRTIFDLKAQIIQHVSANDALSFFELCKIYGKLEIYQLECFPLHDNAYDDYDDYEEDYSPRPEYGFRGDAIPSTPPAMKKVVYVEIYGKNEDCVLLGGRLIATLSPTDHDGNNKLLTSCRWTNDKNEVHHDWAQPVGLYCSDHRRGHILGDEITKLWSSLSSTFAPTATGALLAGGVSVKFVKLDRKKYEADKYYYVTERYWRSASGEWRNNHILKEHIHVQKSSYEQPERTEHFSFFTLVPLEKKVEEIGEEFKESKEKLQERKESKEKILGEKKMENCLQIQTVGSLYSAIEKSLAEQTTDGIKRHFKLFDKHSYDMLETTFNPWKKDDYREICLINFFSGGEEIICEYDK